MGWADNGVRFVTRTLKYPKNWPGERAREKVIDVRLAIDTVTLAHEYDVAIVASRDTDLSPAVEHVATNLKPGQEGGGGGVAK